MDLSIIIVSWNVREKLRENIKALYESTGDFEFEIFVVDNNSSDKSVEMIEKEFPKVKVIANKENLGFAKANNQAIKKSKGDFILLLNPDMRVSSDTLENMLKWMRNNPQATVSGCKLINNDGKIVKHVRNFPTFIDQLAIILKLPHLFPQILKNYIRENFDYSKAQKVDSIRGGFFMYRYLDEKPKTEDRDVAKLNNIMLDERYFVWFEEVDLCKRLKVEGKEVWYTPTASCLDHVGQSFQQVPRLTTQKYFRDSMLKYFKKWHSPWQYRILWLAWLVGFFITWAGGIVGFKAKKNS